MQSKGNRQRATDWHASRAQEVMVSGVLLKLLYFLSHSTLASDKKMLENYWRTIYSTVHVDWLNCSWKKKKTYLRRPKYAIATIVVFNRSWQVLHFQFQSQCMSVSVVSGQWSVSVSVSVSVKTHPIAYDSCNLCALNMSVAILENQERCLLNTNVFSPD